MPAFSQLSIASSIGMSGMSIGMSPSPSEKNHLSETTPLDAQVGYPLLIPLSDKFIFNRAKILMNINLKVRLATSWFQPPA
ncbi:hypothetical protein CEXT_19341 [Caerostris extrusa]|uniref:Uncharacterized protein n=1 Tax=Caerostris extrusa TaxID=172846 RepID=A0AAV4Y4D7_CAEEX|nr:hypothetical protein CEXT_19341 [Caerostris extrusa]